MTHRFDHRKIEKAAQKKWEGLNLYQTDLTDGSKDPYYLLFEFPYPSGDLHIGHWYAFSVTDIYARILRMRGKNVLFPIGFDAFGLPAENAAMKNGEDPKAWTYANMDRMRTQLRSMGTSVDWSKEVITCDPNYYHWTQWLFAKLFEHGLAERREAAVKWCPKDMTVLANEQVIDGHCERCGSLVEEKILTQWFLKITQYAERLLNDLDALPWREEIKDAQRAWIGKSEGAKISFPVANRSEKIEVFTTRPDTIFGATYVVLAPEHPLLNEFLEYLDNETDVQAYIELTKQKTERERQEQKEKTGVRLEGLMAINPATKEQIPIYVADYVLGSYGTGAVMAVPAHDERDFEFAKNHNLLIKQVVVPVLVQPDGPGAFREGEPIFEKHGVIALVKHWSEDKYIGLKWREVTWGTLLTGGVDEGYTPEQTVIKEIHEETGFKHARIVRKLGIIDGVFYHPPKNRNQHVHGHMFLIQLEDGEQDSVAADEAAKHEIQWMTLPELQKYVTAGSHQHLLNIVMNGDKPYIGPGTLVDSGEFTGKQNVEAMWNIAKAVGGERTTQYRLRDWLVSRQRYWGCPIPIVYDPNGVAHLVPAEHLPWLLPSDVDFTPTGKPPLASSKELHERVEKLFGAGWTPEYDTLDTFVDSSWYFLRYLDPKDEHDFSDQTLMQKWLPVNRYSGGSEHTTMHLLYARFLYKALYDLALVPTAEPFNERLNRGIILGPDGQKMSKSHGNVVNPDEVVAEHGADAVRMYLAFIGPYNEPGHYPWSLDGVAAMRKFLDRAERFVEKNKKSPGVMVPAFQKQLAMTADQLTNRADLFKFNTCIASLMTFLSMFEKREDVPRAAVEAFIIMLAPLAPHLTEYLWEALGKEGSVHAAPWPTYDPKFLHEEFVSIAIQVNGKRRGEIKISKEAPEDEVLSLAKAEAAVQFALGGNEPKKVIYVPGKILNLVV